MKKYIILSSLLTILLFNIWYSSNDVINSLYKVANNFDNHCYNYYAKLDSENLNKFETYKVDINYDDLVITQNNYLLPYKRFQEKTNIYNYSFNWIDEDTNNFSYDFLSDYNKETYLEFDINNWYSLELNFSEDIKNFDFNFEYDLKNLSPVFYIFKDWKYIEVKKESLENFSFSKIKIVFENTKSNSNLLEHLVIKELSFKKKEKTILLKSFFDKDIEFFSDNNCKDSKNPNFKPYNFEINSDTKTLEIILEKNPIYNVYAKKDSDSDLVFDDEDNCVNVHNPKQEDSNSDWKWDLCSDDDKDWIIWNKDNCINIYNPDQKDININWVGDVCEFDKDSDSVFDQLDNCINIANPDQKDDDNDWIWNACDNCEVYNPRQLDTDWNWIWDVCDENKKKLEENDNDKDEIINWKDNCPNVKNPDQGDKDKDWVWDTCDNCPDIQNTDQLDLNKNWVWDMCEDSDSDSIIWYLDNCINVANPDQKDDDNNWIWNACEDTDHDWILFFEDNCPYIYNKDQSDVDKDWIWDKCDEKDDRYIESNKVFFIWLLVILSLVFSFLIFSMINKLKKEK